MAIQNSFRVNDCGRLVSIVFVLALVLNFLLTGKIKKFLKKEGIGLVCPSYGYGVYPHHSTKVRDN